MVWVTGFTAIILSGPLSGTSLSDVISLKLYILALGAAVQHPRDSDAYVLTPWPPVAYQASKNVTTRGLGMNATAILMWKQR